jgi:hypothetical protein
MVRSRAFGGTSRRGDLYADYSRYAGNASIEHDNCRPLRACFCDSVAFEASFPHVCRTLIVKFITGLAERFNGEH